MTASSPPLPEDCTAESDMRDGWRISRDGVFAGHVFPFSRTDLGGRWCARLPGRAALPCADVKAAVDHITQRLEERS
jgi:hypothetical protein